MSEELISAIEDLTESVRNLSSYVQELKMSFTSNDNKLNYLSDKLDDSTKAIQKLTGEVTAVRFK